MSGPARKLQRVVKIDADTISRPLSQRGRHIDGMPTFTVAGVAYDYLTPAISVPLTTGGTARLYGEASRWGHGLIIVSWPDDERHLNWAWIPVGNVRRLTDSEWDITEYQRCPPERRPIHWGTRLPGFLPA